MNIKRLQENVEKAHQLVRKRQGLKNFIDAAADAKMFWVGVPGKPGSLFSGLEPTVYINFESQPPELARAADVAREQIAGIERQLVGFGLTEMEAL